MGQNSKTALIKIYSMLGEKEKIVAPSSNLKTPDYFHLHTKYAGEEMTMQEVLATLAVVSNLRQGEKLIVSNNALMVDQSYLPFLSRYVMGHSRADVYHHLEKMLHFLKKLSLPLVRLRNSKENVKREAAIAQLIELKNLLQTCLTGFRYLIEMYFADGYYCPLFKSLEKELRNHESILFSVLTEVP